LKVEASEEHVASILRIEEEPKQEISMKQAASNTGFLCGLSFDPKDGEDMFLRKTC
jgi:hypothetical protein